MSDHDEPLKRKKEIAKQKKGLDRELNPGPPALPRSLAKQGGKPEAGIILLDHQAVVNSAV